MSMTDFSLKDSFWSRVRASLWRAPHLTPGKGVIGAGQEDWGIRTASGRPLDELLRQVWDDAQQRQVCLCVMVLEVDCFADYLAAYGREAGEDCLDALEMAIGAVLNGGGDFCQRLGQGGFVLILADFSPAKARNLAGRIAQAVRSEKLVNKESHAGMVTLSTGLAVADAQAPFDRGVFDLAQQAQRKAQRRGLGRLEVADFPAPIAPAAPSTAPVAASSSSSEQSAAA